MKKRSRRKKSKINKYTIRRILAISLVILVALLLKTIISFFGNANKEIPLTVLLNNNDLTLKREVVIDESENIYFSKEDIQNIFDETIYYNEAEKELITTYNKHTALLKIDENSMIVNDSNVTLLGTLQEINKLIYLPIKDLEIVYDIEVDYSKENNKVIIDSTSKEKIQGTTLKNTKIKLKKGLLQKTIEKLNAGETVVVLENIGNYKKVRTALGNIGYVKTKKITNEQTIRENMEEEVQELKVYKEYSNISGIYDDVDKDSKMMNVVIPTFFYLDKNNKVLNKTTSSTATYANYMNWVNKNELSVLPTLENNESVSDTLLTYSQRNDVINSLYSLIVKYQFKGININFKTIDDINSFYRFIIEMTPRFKESGLIVCVTLNSNIDKSKIQKITNYIIEE